MVEVLKQPLQTCVAIDVLEFESFNVEERVHIGISVKDFKSIVLHAETLKASIAASFSRPSHPMQLSYRERGMQCEFTLMTTGEYRGGSVTPAPAVAQNSSATPSDRQAPRQSPATQSLTEKLPRESSNAMPPPTQPASRSFAREFPSQRPPRPSPPPPKASLDEESLFIPAESNDDRRWGEKIFDEDEDILGWDPNAENVGIPVS